MTDTPSSTEPLIEQLRHELSEAVQRDEVVLPTLPEVALQVRDAADDPDITLRDLSQIIGRDAALSARLIKVTNSPLVRSPSPIDSLPAAITRLGTTYTCSLALGLAMEQMFQATSDAIDQHVRRVWKHSVEVAATASVLARQYTRLNPEQAMLAGLVHQIGVLPVLSYIEENSLLQDPRMEGQLDTVIDALHPEIGSLILKLWGFPDSLVEVPVHSSNLQYQSPGADYADLVIVASLHCVAGSEHPLADTDWSQVPSFYRLGIDVEGDNMEVIELTGDVEATVKALS